jgi:hypothetical protein
MKIVKSHKNRSAHSESFGIWSGKTLAEIPVGEHDHQVSFGGLQDKIEHIKVGNGSFDAFLWFDNIQEAGEFGQKLVDIAQEAKNREQSK